MAELKIKADSGGGTVGLKGPATTTGNAAVQLTLPVDDGAANQYLKTDGNGALSWATVSQTEQDASTGDYTLTSGNLVMATAGKGIDFSATADGSGTDSSSLLDDYEEGTWTPVLKSGSDTITYDSGSYSRYTYTKIGNMVTVWMTLDNRTTAGTTGGEFAVHGLPYATVSSTGRMVNMSTVWYGSGLRLNNWPVATHAMPGASDVQFLHKSSASANYVPATLEQVGANSYLFFTHTYEVDS